MKIDGENVRLASHVLADRDFWEAYTARPLLKRGKRGKIAHQKAYHDIMLCFDIETTRLVEIEQSIMYIWMLKFDDVCTIIGRTWDEYREIVAYINSYTPEDRYVVCYVHNLSYEFSFLKGIFDFEKQNVFAINPRKVLKAITGVIEYRCSYHHSGMSLREFTTKFAPDFIKLSGKEYNYQKRRYPWTKLSHFEMSYCVRDVVGLWHSLKNEMRLDGDTLYSIPMTITGYIRRDVRLAMRRGANLAIIREQLPDFELYTVLRRAFRGGNTHANRYIVGDLIEGTIIHSADRSSSYPDVQCNQLFPMSAFYRINNPTVEEASRIINERHRAALLEVELWEVDLIDPLEPIPYLTEDKSRELAEAVIDNGRVLKAYHLRTTVTDLDLKIILAMYECKINIHYMYHARYGKLPRALTDIIKLNYVAKTALKNVKGREHEYMRGKSKLNSIFGMSAQNPISIPYEYDPSTRAISEAAEYDMEALLQESNRNAVQSYAWGVWVTAWARYELQRCIDIVHSTEGALVCYVDTDSVKYLGKVDFTEYNNDKIKASTASGACAVDPAGVTHYMGVMEQEADMQRFRTWGAKKYAYEDLEGKLHITVAGVGKAAGAAELAERGGLEVFEPGFVFYKGGGTESIYNDNPDVAPLHIDGHTLEITSNVVIRESTYHLGITETYEDLLTSSTRLLTSYWERAKMFKQL